jgi:hypothetical protein
MEKKVEKARQKISVRGKTNSKGFVYLRTLITITVLLLVASGVLLALGSLFKNNSKALEKANVLIEERNSQVEYEIN